MTPARQARTYDAIVVGGGLAGIAAAARLNRAGKTVALIEARPRLGGRVQTVHDPAVDYPIELGPEWFDSFGTIHRLHAGAHLTTPEADGGHLLRLAVGLRNIEEVADGGAELRRRLGAVSGADQPVLRALQQCCPGAGHAAARAMLLHYIEGFHAADPAQLSLRWFRKVESEQPASVSECRSRVGLDQAVNAFLAELSGSCTVYLDTVVRTVHWRRGHVAIDVTRGDRRGTISAPLAIVTLPLSILQSTLGPRGAVRFVPPLTAKRPAFERLATGPVLKTVHVFDQPFWNEIPGVEGALFLQDFSQPIPTWWSTRPVDAPVLVGWAAGPQVARVGRLSAEALRSVALGSLAHALGVRPATVERHWRGWHWHDWQRDPFAQGAYSWVRAGGIDAHAILARPLDATLYFAGEATVGDGFNATMDGAIQSGWRASEEALSAT